MQLDLFNKERKAPKILDNKYGPYEEIMLVCTKTKVKHGTILQ